MIIIITNSGNNKANIIMFNILFYLLSFTVPPYITDQSFDTISIFGNTAFLQCQASGLPVPNITWLKDDAILNNPDITVVSNVTDFTRSSKLVFTNLSFADTGAYICQASNYLVSMTLADSLSIQLTVNCE